MSLRQSLSAAFLIVCNLVPSSASAQIQYNSQEDTYLQSFDTLPSSGSSFLWTDNSTISGWYVGSSASSFNNTLGISTGSTTTGNIYSFGLANATERALGSIASGSTNFFYGLKAINNTATTITGFTISYTGEQWRNSAAAAQSLSFQYSIGATTLKNGNYVTVPMVGFSSPITGGTAGLLNGNLTANRVNVGPITVSNLNWLPGTPLWLRFTDIDDAGYDHGLAIDNFSFAAAGTAPAWDPPAGYYDAATGLSGEPLAAALHGIIGNNLVVPYASTATTDTKAALKSLFEDPADATKIQLTYSGNSVLKTDPSWDRERLWPTSRGIASTDNANSDLFNLRPSYSSINSARNNKLYDNSDWYDANYASPAAALAAADTSTDSNSWQPPASEVGDIARALFYMDVRYNGGDGNALDLALDNGIVNGSSMAVLSTLLQWSHDDPVSEDERKRNATIYSIYQHNRNPFVDHPEYVDSVFGYLVTEADDLDLDGIPNDWENAHQFNPTDATDANADTDTDGFTNYEEYWMGSDPRDAASPARFLVDRASIASTQDGSVASPFKTIQAAINATGANDIRAIVVRPGTYPERPYANGKNIIHLFSEAGAAATIIDGQQVDSSVVRLYAFQKASFVGFTVRNAATSNYGAGLRIDAASGTALIANNILTGNVSTNTTNGGGGLYLKTAHHSRVINNFILGNTATRGGGVLFAGGDADFWFNTVAGNAATGTPGASPNSGNGGGLSAMQGVHPDVRDNILWNNTGSAPAAQLHQISATYARNNIVQNAAANSGNLSADPLFLGNGDYHLSSASPAKDAAFALPVVTDFDGDPRPGALGLRDLGADEIATTNNDPVAQNQSVTLPEDGSASIVLGPILPEGWTYSVQTPAHGSATEQAGTCTYLPVAHYNGSDSFTFQLRKNGQVQSTATITLTITPVDDPPLVDAGANQVLILPATANLAATLTDIDTPAANLICTWSQEDGPGTVTFGTPNARATTATFSALGDYLLVATVSDGTTTRSDSLLISVVAEASPIVISITSPADNSVFVRPNAVPFSATVSGGMPTKVEFYEGSRLLSIATSSPYSFNWNNSQSGTYRITARATDSAGHISLSNAILVSVTGSGEAMASSGPGNNGNPNSGGNGGVAPGSPGGSFPGGTPAPDPDADDDKDGLTNAEEAERGTNPKKKDSDGDGKLDGEEMAPMDKYITLPRVPESHYAVLPIQEITVPVDKTFVNDDGAIVWQQTTTVTKVYFWKPTLAAPVDITIPNAKVELKDFFPDDTVLLQYTPDPVASTVEFPLAQKCRTSSATWSQATGVITHPSLLNSPLVTDLYTRMNVLWQQMLPDARQAVNDDLQRYRGNTSVNDETTAIYQKHLTFLAGTFDPIAMSQKTEIVGSGECFIYPIGFDADKNIIAAYYQRILLSNTNTVSPFSAEISLNGLCKGSNGVYSLYDPTSNGSARPGYSDFHLDGQYRDLPAAEHSSITFVSANNRQGFVYGRGPDGINGIAGNGPISALPSAEGQLTNTRQANQPFPLVGVRLDYGESAVYRKENGVWKEWAYGIFNEDHPAWISDRLEMLLTDTPSIWRNGRAVELAGLVGEDSVWESISPRAISPTTGFIYGGATKTKNPDGTVIPQAQRKTYAVCLLPVEVAVDANRDGVIKFAGNYSDPAVASNPTDTTSTEKPFRFWLNDDDDKTDGTEQVPVSTPDNQYSFIEGKRDLEDFTRLHVNIGGLQEAIVKGDIQIGFEWKNVTGTPAIWLHRAYDSSGKADYLSDETAAANQTGGVYGVAVGKVASNAPLKLDKVVFQSLSTSNPNAYFIFDGAAEGKGQLVMTFWKGTEKIGEGGSVWIDLKNIKKMYQRGVADIQNPSIPYNYTNNPPDPGITLVADPNAAQSFEKPWDETAQCTVLVHGFNVTYVKDVNMGETTFKRLWWRGYKGRFAVFRWPTLGDGSVPAGAIGTYNDSEYRAWHSGAALKQFVSGLPYPDARNIIAHSMGNLVTGEAIREGMNVSHYAMLHAAASAGCYSNAGFQFQTTNTGVITPDTDSDPSTRYLAYTGWLGQIGVHPINFRDNQDSVVGSIWNYNNGHFKPQKYNGDLPPDPFGNGTTGYYYSPSAASGQKLGITYWLSVGRFVTDSGESKAYANYSLTGAIGFNETAGGSITDYVDDSYFGDEHSAEWEWTIQKLKTFYDTLLLKFELPRNP